MNVSRREMLGASVAAMAAGPTLFANESAANRVRLAVMGCHAGGRGFQVMKGAMKVPNVEIACVCDVDARALSAAAAEVLAVQGRAPKQVADLREVLADASIDGVICAVPDHWHAPAALMCMKAGKAIYVEKPVSHNPHEGEVLVQASEKFKVPFQMGNQRRSSTVYREAIAAIRAGEIGETRFARTWYTTRREPIGKGVEGAPPDWLNWELWQGPALRRAYRSNLVHYNWHWFFDYGTGECGNNATHFVDVARWALGCTFPERTVSGGGRLFHSGDDWQWFDTQTASWEFGGGKFISWEGLSAAKGRPYEGAGSGAMVYGNRGSVLFAPNDACTLFDVNGVKVRDWKSDRTAGDASSNRTSPSGDLDVKHVANWVAAIRDRTLPTHSPAHEAHASTLLTHLANIALRTGETIRLDPNTGRLAAGSAGKELWSREYAAGWEMKI